MLVRSLVIESKANNGERHYRNIRNSGFEVDGMNAKLLPLSFNINTSMAPFLSATASLNSTSISTFPHCLNIIHYNKEIRS